MMSRLTRDGTAEPVSRDQILRHARGQENIIFPCSADHEQDWQPYPVDPYSAIYVMTIHTYILRYIIFYIGAVSVIVLDVVYKLRVAPSCRAVLVVFIHRQCLNKGKTST